MDGNRRYAHVGTIVINPSACPSPHAQSSESFQKLRMKERSSSNNTTPPCPFVDMNGKPSNLSLDPETSHDDGSKESISYCCHKSGPDVRNLIVCIDGTANQFGQKNTNVIEFYNLLRKEDRHNQLTWYNSGIGTYARPSWKSLRYYRQVVNHKIDLAIAWNFERTVLAAYRWLSDNYKEGDRIFLYGFSRGAFQVRVLSAMIHKVGLIHKGNEEQIPFAYELYADPNSDEIPASDKPIGVVKSASLSLLRKLKEKFGRIKQFTAKTKDEATEISGDRNDSEGTLSMAAQFKQAFSHENADPHFVGAWDTVSSIGIMRGKCMLPGTIDGMKHVCYFRHALALDERRVKFSPEYAYGDSTLKKGPEESLPATGAQPPVSGDDQRSSDSKTLNPTIAVPPPHTLEVWFAGTHSDIGGGNAVNKTMDRSRPPLRWMVFESVAAGLRTKLFDRVLKPSEQIELQESLTGVWWFLEFLPLKRLTFTRKEDGKKTTYKPHLGSPRKIHDGQKIHGSLTLSDKDGYIPKARPVGDDPSFWANVRTLGLGSWKADDLFEGTKDLVDKFIDKQALHVWELLRRTAITVDGRQAVYDGVLGALGNPQRRPPVDVSVKHDVVQRTIQILNDAARTDMALRKVPYKDAWRVLGDCWRSDNTEYQSCFRRFVRQFVESGPRVEMEGHSSLVSNISISANGTRVVSCSWDYTIRIWDSETGVQIGEPISEHTDYINDVAFSLDGLVIASASADKTVRLWNAETGKAIGGPLMGHLDWVRSVAFSPDSKRVASGSDDNTIRIWDVDTGKSVGDLHNLVHEYGGINSVAFNPDGKYVASASKDGTVRIWDVEASQPVGEPLKGHDNWALCVAFSPDGRYIASGSLDCTVRVWDLETRAMVGWPFRGHQLPVRSVAFSPDSRWIVSSGDENTALMWNMDTHVIQSKFLHNDSVRSILFFPDGKGVASACTDGLVRIWNSETL